MSKHHISRAQAIYAGAAYYPPLTDANERLGAPITFMTKVDLGTPDTGDLDGVSDAHDGTSVLSVVIDGALATGGVATFAFPRAVSIDTNSAGDTTQTATITGTDVYGEDLVEIITFNGTTAVVGQKAFKTVTAVTLSATLTGTCDIGESEILGLPYALSDKSNLLSTWFGGVDEATLPTIVVADTTAVTTGTTNDVRGTLLLNSTLDESQIYLYMVVDASTKALMVGVDQYGG